MLEINFVLVISIVLLGLVALLVVLFLKHLDFVYILVEDIQKNQRLLYKEILELKLSPVENLIESKAKDTKPKFQVNKQISDLKSSQVSREELEKLIKDKDLMFTEQVNLHPEEMFKDTNISI